MSEKNITKISASKHNVPKGKTDWDKLHQMTDEETQQLARSDPDAQPMTASELKKMRRAVDIKKLRKSLRLSQRQFADTFHLSCRTLQDWEQGRSLPDRTAIAFLTAIKNNPRAIVVALNGA